MFITGRVMKPGMMNARAVARLSGLEGGDREGADEGRERAVKSLFMRGIGYYRNGKYREAVRELNEVLELDPLHAGAQAYLERAEKHLD